MGNVTKKVWILLIIVALALPIFVGCEPEPEAPPATDYKAEFLSKLSTEVGKIEDAEVELDGQNFSIDLVGITAADFDDIKEAAAGFVATIKNLPATGSLTITEFEDYGNNPYSIESDLTQFKTDAVAYFEANTETSLTLNYTANVTYKGKAIELEGEIVFTNVPIFGDDD